MPAETQSHTPRIEARALRIKDAAQAYGISRSLIYKMMGTAGCEPSKSANAGLR